MTCPRGWTEMGWDDRGKGDDVRAWDVPEETDEVVDPVLQVSRAGGVSNAVGPFILILHADGVFRTR